MAKHAPGKHYRIGISLVDAVKRFSDEAEAERLFVEARWPDGWLRGMRLGQRQAAPYAQACALPVP